MEGKVVYDSYAIITRCHLATDTVFFYTSWPLRFHFIFNPQILPFSIITLPYYIIHFII